LLHCDRLRFSPAISVRKDQFHKEDNLRFSLGGCIRLYSFVFVFSSIHECCAFSLQVLVFQCATLPRTPGFIHSCLLSAVFMNAAHFHYNPGREYLPVVKFSKPSDAPRWPINRSG
jgi:hypothetical protein